MRKEYGIMILLGLIGNMLYSMFVVHIYLNTFETQMGCACDYWRCIETANFHLLPVLLFISCVFNFMLLVVFFMGSKLKR